MRFTHYAHIATLLALAGYVVAAPTGPQAEPAAAAPSPTFPLPDGFPKPNPQQLQEIQRIAGGSLPNAPLPKKLTPAATAVLQLLELNEVFEVSFFTSLLHNITTNVPGYELTGEKREFAIKAIGTIQKQEELHAIGVNAILASAGQTQVQPCKYIFPVTDFQSAIFLAQTFTDVVLGLFPQAQTLFASDGGEDLFGVNLFGSVLGQEAEQVGWFRSVQGKVPSAAPFLTTEGPSFAFTFLQSVIVPGSCPGAELVAKSIPTFGALNVVTSPMEKNTTLTFSVSGSVTAEANSLVYLSGQNLPVTVPIFNVQSQGSMTHFCASFPFESQHQFARGLTIAAVVKGTGMNFKNSTEVASQTVFGPGIIEVD